MRLVTALLLLVAGVAHSAVVANAGPDQTVKLGVTCILNGTKSTTDGIIQSWTWAWESGPFAPELSASTSPQASVDGLVLGVHVFKLTVTDNQPSSSTDTVEITVRRGPKAVIESIETITLPVDSVVLDGSASTSDTGIASYKWSMVDGPNVAVIVDDALATTTATELDGGTYDFKLVVTDLDGFTGEATVSAHVNKPPIPIVGKAYQVVNYPLSATYTLDGSSSRDMDGSIVSYLWETTGGGNPVISSPNSAVSDVSGLEPGSYSFRLTVVDNDGASVMNNVILIVNRPPMVSAGDDQVITLPGTIVLSAEDTLDLDGHDLVEFLWEYSSGSASPTIVSPGEMITEVTGFDEGSGVSYFKVTVTDSYGGVGTDTVKITINRRPLSVPGSDKFVNVPSSVSLDGSGSSDPDGTIQAFSWVSLSGPSSPTFTTPSLSKTSVTGLVSGTYVIQLQVTDNRGSMGNNSLSIYANGAPIADAGDMVTIHWFESSATLDGSGSSDSDGTIDDYLWQRMSGPGSPILDAATSATTLVESLQPGEYVYKLTVVDNNGASSSDEVTVRVNLRPIANIVPIALMNSPANSAVLNGSLSRDQEQPWSAAEPLTFKWKCTGPGFPSIQNSEAGVTTVQSLSAGTTTCSLTVTDSDGGTDTKDVAIEVNLPPTAAAGADMVVTIPPGSIQFDGSESFDFDGTIQTYSWRRVSGPSATTITGENSATPTVTGFVQGVSYVFELKVLDDDGASGVDTIEVQVKLLPIAVAGPNVTIILPDDSLTLNGDASSDGDGNVVGYSWSTIKGPSTPSFGNPSASQTPVTNIVHGYYEFLLTVRDNEGYEGTDVVTVTVKHRPTANAGADVVISSPTSSTTLNGGSSFDTPSSGTSSLVYLWEAFSGNNAPIFSSASSSSTVVSSLFSGVYTIRLTVTDVEGLSDEDYVLITVNKPPVPVIVAHASIILPSSAVLLNATTSFDSDGTIVSYFWEKTIGNSVSLDTPSSSLCTASSLALGEYTFKLTVVDNLGASASKTFDLVVREKPTADAGPDVIITYPESVATLTGSGADSDGSIASFLWEWKSGPKGATIASPGSAATSVSGMTEPGIYVFEFSVEDADGLVTSDTAQVIVNLRPIAVAGANQTIYFPNNQVSLDGSASSDPDDGVISSYKWMILKTSGTADLLTASSIATGLVSLSTGEHWIELTVTDSRGATGTDVVIVTLLANPIANAGADVVITVPETTALLNGTESSAWDGTSLTVKWTQLSGPSLATILSSTSLLTGISGLVVGDNLYVFQLDVTDVYGLSSSDTVKVLVNRPPTAKISPLEPVVRPTDFAVLSGTLSTDPDPGDSIVKYAWSVLSGPNTPTLPKPNAVEASITDLILGVYSVRLTVTDEHGATAHEDVELKMLARPVAQAHTSSSIVITLPTSSVSLTGTASDDDGSVVEYLWTVESSPQIPSLSSSTTAATTVSGMTVQGSYILHLTVRDNDNLWSSASALEIIINVAPIPDAGSDHNVILPVTASSLDGSGSSDPDGTIQSYFWQHQTGPNVPTIVSPSSVSSTVTGMAMGDHTFQLTVTDNLGVQRTDTVVVSVLSKPVADVGPDLVATLPSTSVTLDGSASYDSDGSSMSFFWEVLSGPGGSSLGSSTDEITTLSGLTTGGNYEVKLTVTDEDGLTSEDKLFVHVNRPPVAVAGDDIELSLTTTTTSLDGSASYDPDGSISTYTWTLVTGPVAPIISTPTEATTAIKSLVPGVFEFKLTVVDEDGGSGEDTVIVHVIAHPTAVTGEDIVITSPLSTSRLNGTLSYDRDGTITAYAWRQLDGPSTATIDDPSSAVSTVQSLVPGSYIFELKVTDNDGFTGVDSVVVKVNLAPVANAGPDQTLTLPITSTTVTGAGSTDADNSQSELSFAWSVQSAPAGGSPNIVSPSAMISSVANLAVNGWYTFKLIVRDPYVGGESEDTVAIFVNLPPLVNAGDDTVVNLPTTATTLSGEASDPEDGAVANCLWSSSVLTDSIDSPTLFTSIIRSMQAGERTVSLSCTDSNGGTTVDSITIRVNMMPVVVVANTTITLPKTAARLNASLSYDPDLSGGTGALAFLWTQLAGPNAATLSSFASPTPTASGVVAGTYSFSVVVTDLDGAETEGFTFLIVNIGPVAKPLNETISVTFPGSSSRLDGRQSYDDDGTIVLYKWTFVSGPVVSAPPTLTTPWEPVTDIEGLTVGVWVFRLEVTDNDGGVGFEHVEVKINLPPACHGGEDQILSLEEVEAGKSFYLNGTASSDSDGSVARYKWVFGEAIGVNATPVVHQPNSAVTKVSGLEAGVYAFDLHCYDSDGVPGSVRVVWRVLNFQIVHPTKMSSCDQRRNCYVDWSGDGLDSSARILMELSQESIVSPGSFVAHPINQLAPRAMLVGSRYDLWRVSSQIQPGTYKLSLSVLDTRIRSAVVQAESAAFSVKVPFDFEVSDWSDCSATCGQGIRTRSVSCVDTFQSSRPHELWQCGAIRPVPAPSAVCFLKACDSYGWKLGPWKRPSICTVVNRTRTVECVNSKGLIVDDKFCQALSAKPVSTSVSDIHIPCPVYSWVAGTFLDSNCPVTCGSGLQSRSVHCFASTGIRVDGDLCSELPSKPTSTQSCGTVSCGDYVWTVGEWSACSEICGGGKQTRSLTCVRKEDGAVVSGLFCEKELGADFTPLSTRSCHTNPCVSYFWQPGAWSACSSLCGEGKRVRDLQCVSSLNERALSVSQCNGVPRPALEERCTDDSGCALTGAEERCDSGVLCSGNGRCSSDGLSCECDGGWSGLFCEVEKDECSADAITIDEDGDCCDGIVDRHGSCCAGRNSTLDASGECCLLGVVDSLGACNGTIIFVDSVGLPCNTTLDAAGACCPSGILDGCGVCDGDDLRCAFEVDLTMTVPPSSDLLDLTSIDRLDVEDGVTTVIANGLNVSRPSVTVTSLEYSSTLRALALGPMSIALTVRVVPPASFAGKLTDAQQEALHSISQADISAVLDPGMGLGVGNLLVSSSSIARTGVCGNGVCEQGERCIDGDHDGIDCCVEDCPVSFHYCYAPQGNTLPCGGHGVCQTGTGQCICFEGQGYSGEHCNTCKDGWAMKMVPAGVIPAVDVSTRPDVGHQFVCVKQPPVRAFWEWWMWLLLILLILLCCFIPLLWWYIKTRPTRGRTPPVHMAGVSKGLGQYDSSILLEGWLRKRAAKGIKFLTPWHLRYFVLRSDPLELRYFRKMAVSEFGAIPLKETRHIPLAVIERITYGPDRKDHYHSCRFNLHCVFPGGEIRVYRLIAPRPKDREEWVGAIEELKEKAKYGTVDNPELGPGFDPEALVSSGGEFDGPEQVVVVEKELVEGEEEEEEYQTQREPDFSTGIANPMLSTIHMLPSEPSDVDRPNEEEEPLRRQSPPRKQKQFRQKAQSARPYTCFHRELNDLLSQEEDRPEPGRASSSEEEEEFERRPRRMGRSPNRAAGPPVGGSLRSMNSGRPRAPPPPMVREPSSTEEEDDDDYRDADALPTADQFMLPRGLKYSESLPAMRPTSSHSVRSRESPVSRGRDSRRPPQHPSLREDSWQDDLMLGAEDSIASQPFKRHVSGSWNRRPAPVAMQPDLMLE